MIDVLLLFVSRVLKWSLIPYLTLIIYIALLGHTYDTLEFWILIALTLAYGLVVEYETERKFWRKLI